METLPLAALAISRGTVNGLTRPDAAVVEDQMLLLDRLDAADARADDDAAAEAVFLVEVDAGVLHRVNGRGESELAEAVEAFGFADVDAVLRDVEVRALAADLDGVGAGVPAGDRLDAALAGAQRVPNLVDALAERGDDSQSGNDYAATAHWSSCQLPVVSCQCESGVRLPGNWQLDNWQLLLTYSSYS
jgi:hypothetical protein